MREIKLRPCHYSQNKMLFFEEIMQNPNLLRMVIDGSEMTLDSMLYTTVKDKNSKEIYKGDIVRASFSIMRFEISTVEFKRGIFYVLQNKMYHPLSEFVYNSKDTTKDLEVIGNIYENKELLK
jgi:uncharacterized phage protein (TIGR01671 family)